MDKNKQKQNKIPDSILNEVRIALSHYPDLDNTVIDFKLTDGVGKSIMRAQPKWLTLFKPTSSREYVILISKVIKIEDKAIGITTIPKKVLIGWLGHELGHVMDYRNRSTTNLIGFGVGYFFSSSYIRKAERTADSYAIQHNMKDYILATKDFILNQSSLSGKYKARIKRLYLSPEEILEIVDGKT